MDFDNKQIEHIAFNLGNLDIGINNMGPLATEISVPDIQAQFETGVIPKDFSLEIMRRKVVSQVQSNWEKISASPYLKLDEEVEERIKGEIHDILNMDAESLDVLEAEVKTKLALNGAKIDRYFNTNKKN